MSQQQRTQPSRGGGGLAALEKKKPLVLPNRDPVFVMADESAVQPMAQSQAPASPSHSKRPKAARSPSASQSRPSSAASHRRVAGIIIPEIPALDLRPVPPSQRSRECVCACFSISMFVHVYSVDDF